MTIRVKTMHHISTSMSVEDIGEFELTRQPDDGFEPLIEVVGDKAVVAYLVQDDDGQNPIEAGSANGELVTKNMGRDSTIWDDESRLRSLLRCGDGRWSGENPDIDRPFPDGNGKVATLREMAADAVFAEVVANREEWQEYVEYLEEEPEEAGDREVMTDMIKTDLLDDNGYKCEEVERQAFDLYEAQWERLAGPFVIPIDYRSYNDTRISTTSWDGDPSELPDGVWVADDDAIENILVPFVRGYLLKAHSERETKTGKTRGGDPYSYEVEVPFFNLVIDGATVRGNIRGTAEANRLFMELVGWRVFYEIRAAATEYADNVLNEVSAWASGECYGCVVETFARVGAVEEPTWEPLEENSVWGYLGANWAEEALKSEYFDPAVKHLKGEV